MTERDEERVKVVARQLGGRIREARLSQRITLSKLSAEANLSPGFLSRLERGETNASISNLIAISSSLGIPLREFFEDASEAAAPKYMLTRARDRGKKPDLSANGYTYHLSSGTFAGQQMSAFELTFPPGEQAPPKLLTHEGEEVLFLLEGTIEFQIGSESLVMKPGDCVHFNCEQPHMGRNIGKVPARLLMVVAPMNSIRHRYK